MENQEEFEERSVDKQGSASTADATANARASLDVLRASSRAARIEGMFPQTPLWYGVALATTIGGFTLFNADEAEGRWTWLWVGGIAAVIMTVHYFSTVAVVPRRSKQSAAVNLAFMAVALTLTVIWGVAISASGEVLVGRLVAVWVLTAAVLVAMIHALNRHRARALAS